MCVTVLLLIRMARLPWGAILLIRMARLPWGGRPLEFPLKKHLVADIKNLGEKPRVLFSNCPLVIFHL